MFKKMKSKISQVKVQPKTILYAVVFIGILCLFLDFGSVAYAASGDKFSLDGASTWWYGLLSTGVGMLTAYLAIKEFGKGGVITGFIIIVVGTIFYFFVKSPTDFFNALKFIPDFFTK
ncbi:TcpD family membrane protein [Carnobacterium maltaromaticum]|uniref:TcpD family membrane protein n=1 Tax=Carnobacterium maltaromaticum TaxID=2751 RepID=UPI0039BDE285